MVGGVRGNGGRGEGLEVEVIKSERCGIEWFAVTRQRTPRQRPGRQLEWWEGRGEGSGGRGKGSSGRGEGSGGRGEGE